LPTVYRKEFKMKQLLVSMSDVPYPSYIIDTKHPTKHAQVYSESLFKWDESIFTNEEVFDMLSKPDKGYIIAWAWS